jgi:hypothetical protein
MTLEKKMSNEIVFYPYEFVVKHGERRELQPGEIAHALNGSHVINHPQALVHKYAGANLQGFGPAFYHKDAAISLAAGDVGYALPGSTVTAQAGAYVHLYPGGTAYTRPGSTIYVHDGATFWVDRQVTAHVLNGGWVRAALGSTVYVYPGGKSEPIDRGGLVSARSEPPLGLVTDISLIVQRGQDIVKKYGVPFSPAKKSWEYVRPYWNY